MHMHVQYALCSWLVHSSALLQENCRRKATPTKRECHDSSLPYTLWHILQIFKKKGVKFIQPLFDSSLNKKRLPKCVPSCE